MATHFDEKGKIFTNVIKKEGIAVIIQTTHQRIDGRVYVRPDDRLIDEMNGGGQFLAITDAVLYNDAGEEIFRTNFLTINRNHIVWMVPEDELQTK